MQYAIQKMIRFLIFTTAVTSTVALSGPGKKNCRQDFKKLCQGQKFSLKNIKGCLGEKTAELTSQCKTFVEKYTNKEQIVSDQKTKMKKRSAEKREAARMRADAKKKAYKDKMVNSQKGAEDKVQGLFGH
jgi:hypothetical protein